VSCAKLQAVPWLLTAGLLDHISDKRMLCARQVEEVAGDLTLVVDSSRSRPKPARRIERMKLDDVT
jgi:hypothetical protein